MINMKIIGTCLYQWELGRQVEIIPFSGMTISEVHFSNPGDIEALVVKPNEVDGKFVANIPNIHLQSGANLVVHTVNLDASSVETLQECVFPVRKRPKPSDYVYTETEVLNYSYLDKRLKDLEGEGIANAVKDYLAENPVQAGATAEEAEQIAQNKEDIEKLSTDKLDATELPTAINKALAQAKASGEFKGEPGQPGQPGKDGYTPVKGVDYFDGKDGKDGQNGADGKNGNDYVLTDADKTEIAELAAELVDVPEGGNVDLTGYIKAPTATVGQTIKVKSVDANGVPTEWEAVDFPSVPTKVSQLANDSGFQTESEVTAIVEEAIADIEIPSGGGGSGSGVVETVLVDMVTTEEVSQINVWNTDIREYDELFLSIDIVPTANETITSDAKLAAALNHTSGVTHFYFLSHFANGNATVPPCGATEHRKVDCIAKRVISAEKGNAWVKFAKYMNKTTAVTLVDYATSNVNSYAKNDYLYLWAVNSYFGAGTKIRLIGRGINK